MKNGGWIMTLSLLSSLIYDTYRTFPTVLVMSPVYKTRLQQMSSLKLDLVSLPAINCLESLIPCVYP